MGNKLLGEVEINLGNESYILKPTFEGIVEMESRAGITIAGLVNRYAALALGITDITAIVYGGLVGAEDARLKKMTFNELGQKIMNHGMTKLLKPCGQIIAAAYSGKPIGEIDVTEQKKKEGAEQEN